MSDHLTGDETDPPEDEEVIPLADVQPEGVGGTITMVRQPRPPHPNAAMEQMLLDAEAAGFSVEAKMHPDPRRGSYFVLQDGCDPPHVGTVTEHEVYGVVVEKTLKRCPKWRARQAERKEGR